MHKNFIIKNDLFFKIYTVGYDPCGESILFTICDGSQVLYSGLVDSFKDNNKNLTLELLNSLNITELDYLCITHPDFDHCYGISDLEDRISKNTTLVLPQNMILFKDDYTDEVKNEINILEKFITMNKNNKRKPYYISCSDCKKIVTNISFTDKLMNIYSLDITSMSPMSQILERNFIKKRDNSLKNQINNDFSIMCSICLGNFKVLLCSDIQDETIILLKNRMSYDNLIFFKNFINYLKIPHHSSPGSERIFELFDKVRVDNSVTTVFRASGLPKERTLEKYACISDNVYSTSKVNIDGKEKPYGVISTTFNISKKTMTTELLHSAVRIK